MTEDDKRTCCLLEIQETEAKYYRTLEDIEKVGSCSPGARPSRAGPPPSGAAGWWGEAQPGRAVCSGR